MISLAPHTTHKLEQFRTKRKKQFRTKKKKPAREWMRTQPRKMHRGKKEDGKRERVWQPWIRICSTTPPFLTVFPLLARAEGSIEVGLETLCPARHPFGSRHSCFLLIRWALRCMGVGVGFVGVYLDQRGRSPISWSSSKSHYDHLFIHHKQFC